MDSFMTDRLRAEFNIISRNLSIVFLFCFKTFGHPSCQYTWFSDVHRQCRKVNNLQKEKENLKYENGFQMLFGKF